MGGRSRRNISKSRAGDAISNAMTIEVAENFSSGGEDLIAENLTPMEGIPVSEQQTLQSSEQYGHAFMIKKNQK